MTQESTQKDTQGKAPTDTVWGMDEDRFTACLGISNTMMVAGVRALEARFGKEGRNNDLLTVVAGVVGVFLASTDIGPQLVLPVMDRAVQIALSLETSEEGKE